jgi:ubiquinone/menaquinone biosynthesis C-methylase UbiE
MKSNEEKLYEQEEIWEESWFSEVDKERIKCITKLVLSLNPNSILDVGCGNGLFLNYFKENHSSQVNRLCGLERSEIAIKHVKTEKHIGNIESLPFDDNEFEFVTCQEVIEHLPTGIYKKALHELARVSSKYILISVPYSENLKKSLCFCPECKTDFNPNYHMRSFNKTILQDIQFLLNSKLIKIGYINHQISFISFLINRFKYQKKIMPPQTICPMCGFSRNSHSKEAETKVIKKALKSVVKYISPKFNKKEWIFGIYEKK